MLERVVCVSELCVRGGGRTRREEEEGTGVHNQKQESHAKMWGKTSKKNTPKKMHPMMMGTAFVDVKLSNYDYVSVTS